MSARLVAAMSFDAVVAAEPIQLGQQLQHRALHLPVPAHLAASPGGEGTEGERVERVRG